MRIRATKRNSGKVIVDKSFVTDQNTRIINLTLRFQTKDKIGHTRKKICTL